MPKNVRGVELWYSVGPLGVISMAMGFFSYPIPPAGLRSGNLYLITLAITIFHSGVFPIKWPPVGVDWRLDAKIFAHIPLYCLMAILFTIRPILTNRLDEIRSGRL